MLIPLRTLEQIEAGRVDLAFRRWARPAVKTGGMQRTAIGLVRFDAVDAVELADVTDDEAQRAGFADRAALATELDRHRDGQLYRVRLHREGEDPRVALREDDALTAEDVAAITGRLDRLDRASTHGAWTRATLALIRDRPAVRAPDLAESVGRETQPFKLDVRKLKNLGLTISLRVGYELSPRGRAYLDRTEGGNAVTDLDPMIARRTWRTVEPIHGMIYFSPEAAEEFERLGLVGRMGYFGSRSAPMGAVGPEVVIATFYNFRPALVRASIPEAWTRATPTEILAARSVAADGALRRSLPDAIGTRELAEAARLARRAAETACEHVEGRPLFAGHASLPWPDADHLVLWHAQTLLREYRGDGHIAALVAAGLSGLEAAITHVATGDVPGAVLVATRAWPDDEWNAAVDDLRTRGILAAGDELSLTEAGREQRQWIEDATDAASVAAYAPLGEEGCSRLRALARPWSRAIIDGGLLANLPPG